MGGGVIKGSIRPWTILVVLLVAALGGNWELKMATAAPSADQCKTERRAGINACKPVVYGKLPTTECCGWVRDAHVECVCPVITPKLAPLIDVNRAVRIVEGCGRRVPRHFKCGSITTP